MLGIFSPLLFFYNEVSASGYSINEHSVKAPTL